MSGSSMLASLAPQLSLPGSHTAMHLLNTWDPARMWLEQETQQQETQQLITAHVS